LKSQIELKFQNKKGIGDVQLKNLGWPTVILNVKTKEVYRPDIRGTLSIFMNISGVSRCKTGKEFVQIPENTFFISNQDENYTLEIEQDKSIETFNIHFGEYFLKEVYSSLINSEDKLLNNYLQNTSAGFTFMPKLYRQDVTFRQLVNKIYFNQNDFFDKLLLDEQLNELLVYLLKLHRSTLKEIERLPILKQSTRIEIYKRLSQSVDYMYSTFQDVIDLDTLAKITCLSKHHFLRLFKVAFGLTPHQFLTEIRISHACRLLRIPQLPIHQIAISLGFENSSSFSRLFFQRMGIYPSEYRSKI
jgi:AraC family transcriptional regulator